MATQGILSVVGKKGKVKFKVVAGCNGFNVKNLAKMLKSVIKKGTPLTAQTIYNMAQEVDLGCEDDLFVISDTEILPARDVARYDPFPELYRSTFELPKFNPRWECGIAAFTELIKDKRE
jgi:hypothetical protein